MFERSEFARRVALARAAMAASGVDLLLVDHAELMAWLTGYTGSETMYRAALLPREGEPWFVLRSLDAEPCRQRTWIADIVGFPDTADPHAVIAGTIRDRGHGGTRIGADFQSYSFTAHTFARFRDLLPEAGIVDLPRISDRLRMVKSAAEISVLAAAAGIADAAMAAVRTAARPGFTAREASAVAAAAYLRLRADTGEVGPIVKAKGDNEFLHAALGDDPLDEGDVLHVELIPNVMNYGARLMRPIVVGSDRYGLEPVAEQLVALQDRQIAAMRPGVPAREVDAVLRGAVLAEGLRRSYDNVTGYALGLYGRTPRTSDFSHAFLPTSDWVLEAGMVFHMYVSAQGLAFSETVVVESGGGRRLTTTARELLLSER